MGERKGQNKYYPPDFDYKVHKSLSGYHGQHPLRERARKLDKGILIIRFEMPYNIWCDGCNSHIGMGVRYNAEKSKIGMYYTTPIFMFRMKCHLCPMHFEIKTDPSNHDYVIIVGARRKEQRWDPTENGQIVPEDRDSQKKLALDSMYKIEHGVVDKSKLDSLNASTMVALVESRATHKDDFLLNQLARKKLRDTKKVDSNKASFDNAIKKRLCLSLNLLPELEQDVRAAKYMKLSTIKSYEEKMEEKQKKLFGGVLMPNVDAASIPLQTASASDAESSAASSSHASALPTPSRARESSIKKIQQIASFNINKIRATAFDLNISGSNLLKIAHPVDVSKEKHDKKLISDLRISQVSTNVSENSIGTLNEETNHNIQGINCTQNVLTQSKNSNHKPEKDFKNKYPSPDHTILSNPNDINCAKNNVLNVLSSQYESSSSSISDDDYL